MLENSSNNTIIENRIQGIHLRNSGNNTIANNDILSSSSWEFQARYSSNNTIYYNNIARGLWEIVESTNCWDDGYPSGGNYWSGYKGTDENRDGIGDTPYIINANNTDRYPLMAQYIIPEFSSFLALPLFFIATLLAVITYKRKRR